MIFVGGDYETSEVSPEEIGRRMQLWNKWVEELRAESLFIDGRALKNQEHQVNNQDALVTDGPFVETKELVTGYFVVKAQNLAQVTEMTKSYPDWDLGGRVQIREIQTF